MYLKDSFSWCPMDEIPESKNQLHWNKNYEPYNDEIENWLLGKLYSSVLIEPGTDGLLRSVDYGRGEQKKNQVWEFLDYHSSKYNGSRLGFNADIRLVISLLKSNPNIKYIVPSQIESVNSFVEAWINKMVDAEPAATQLQTSALLKETETFTASPPTAEIKSQTEQTLNKSKLTTQLEVAMYYFYMGEVLTRDNCIEKCRLMGVDADSDKPYQHFSEYSEKTNRTGNPESKRKLKNRIDRIERVLAILPEEKKGLAADELKLNERLFENL